MSKKSLSNGVSIKVENRSGFDKSFFNALTTGVGTLTPIVKQLMLPNSSGNCSVKISAQLPPLATDAFLRSHLKLEAFFVPMRLCYGGFESWFSGKEIYDQQTQQFSRAELPRLLVYDYNERNVGYYTTSQTNAFKQVFGQGSLLDYFGVYWRSDKNFRGNIVSLNVKDSDTTTDVAENFSAINIFPFISYALIYDEFYRNKLVERPLFAPPIADNVSPTLQAYHLPYIASNKITNVVGASAAFWGFPNNPNSVVDTLLNGNLVAIRQRNYGDDYFTAATPTAQEGAMQTVYLASGQTYFTIGSLRLGNALQEFKEVNNFASPDYIQTLSARYGASLKYGVAQKPILLGSADFPMYTSGVEQTAQGSGQSVNNPFDTVGARYGRGHAEGMDFVCSFNVDEPGYFMVIASFVPEAQYFQGISKDMMLFTDLGSLTDLPTGLLEHVGNEGISISELLSSESFNNNFGYVQRYLWHKLGNRNQVHGLFRMDESLGAFVVQRDVTGTTGISSNFLKVNITDLDNIAAVSAGISGFGVMIDSAIKLFVSEPLTESAIPALANPAREHGRSVYIKTGGSKLA